MISTSLRSSSSRADVRWSGRREGDLGVGAGSGVEAAATPCHAGPWSWLRQVHGAAVRVVDEPGGVQGDEGDALVTAVPGVALAVFTADCAPVALAAPKGSSASSTPDGGGREAGVVEAAVAAMRGLGATRVDAVLGPCIRPGCYEFGRPDLDRLAARFGPAVRALHVGRPPVARPPGGGRRRARRGGRGPRRRPRGLHGLLAGLVQPPRPRRDPAPGHRRGRPAVTADAFDGRERRPPAGSRIADRPGARLAPTDRRRAGRSGSSPSPRASVIDAVEAAVAAGVTAIGENYGQELVAKAARGAGGDVVRWHFIGAVQRNKVAHLAPFVAVWQSVDRAAAAEAIARHSPGATALVEVNLVGDPARTGCAWDAAPGVVEAARQAGLTVVGLMGIGPAGPPDPAFRPPLGARGRPRPARGVDGHERRLRARGRRGGHHGAARDGAVRSTTSHAGPATIGLEREVRMASGFLRRAMIQLGLVDDDEYDEYEVYEDSHPVTAGVGRGRQGVDQLETAMPQVRPLAAGLRGRRGHPATAAARRRASRPGAEHAGPRRGADGVRRRAGDR